MANISRNERKKWENNLYIYEAGLEVLKTKIKLLNIEYNMLAKKEGFSEIQKEEIRIKKPESIADKLEKKGLEFTVENVEQNMNDVVGYRIVCLTLTEVYFVVDLLKKMFGNSAGFKVLKCKDYIKEPKSNGYQSYHIIVVIPVVFSEKTYYVNAEVQVRTMAMDAWATLEHKLGYKPSQELTDMAELIKAQFEAYAKMVESTDRLVAAASEQGNQKVKK